MSHQYFAPGDGNGEGERVRACVDQRQAEATAADQVSLGWQRYIEGVVADAIGQEREFQSEVVGTAVGEMIADLRREFERELKRSIREAFLERTGSGLIPRYCGVFRQDERYERLSIVSKDGGLWLATVSDPHGIPGEGQSDWTLMSMRGRVGPRGERGETGPRGPQGPAGEVPVIVDWRIDPVNLTATPLMADGGKGAPLKFGVLLDLHARAVERAANEKVLLHPGGKVPPTPLIQIVHGAPEPLPVEEPAPLPE